MNLNFYGTCTGNKKASEITVTCTVPTGQIKASLACLKTSCHETMKLKAN